MSYDGDIGGRDSAISNGLTSISIEQIPWGDGEKPKVSRVSVTGDSVISNKRKDRHASSNDATKHDDTLDYKFHTFDKRNTNLCNLRVDLAPEGYISVYMSNSTVSKFCEYGVEQDLDDTPKARELHLAVLDATKTVAIPHQQRKSSASPGQKSSASEPDEDTLETPSSLLTPTRTGNTITDVSDPDTSTSQPPKTKFKTSADPEPSPSPKATPLALPTSTTQTSSKQDVFTMSSMNTWYPYISEYIKTAEDTATTADAGREKKLSWKRRRWLTRETEPDEVVNGDGGGNKEPTSTNEEDTAPTTSVSADANEEPTSTKKKVTENEETTPTNDADQDTSTKDDDDDAPADDDADQPDDDTSTTSSKKSKSTIPSTTSAPPTAKPKSESPNTTSPIPSLASDVSFISPPAIPQATAPLPTPPPAPTETGKHLHPTVREILY
ncbi:unnamed protein product [Alternaria alternata]